MPGGLQNPGDALVAGPGSGMSSNPTAQRFSGGGNSGNRNPDGTLKSLDNPNNPQFYNPATGQSPWASSVTPFISQTTPQARAWTLLQSMLGAGTQYMNPQSAADQAGISNIFAQQGLQGQILGNQQAGALLGYQHDLAHLNAAMAGNKADRGYGMTLEDAAGKERDIQNAHYQNQFGYQNAMANTQYSGQMQELYSDATARGAITTGGTVNKRDLNNQQLVEQLAQNQDVFNTGKGMTGVQYEREFARGQHMVNQADAIASTYGTDKQNLLATLNNGLEGLGLKNKMDGLDLIQKATGLSADSAAAAQSIIDMLMGQANTNPQAFLTQYGTSGMSTTPFAQQNQTRQWGSGSRRIG